MTQKRVLIFDLDGTLIDSAPTFSPPLQWFWSEGRHHCASAASTPAGSARPLAGNLVTISGTNDPQRIQALIESFKQKLRWWHLPVHAGLSRRFGNAGCAHGHGYHSCRHQQTLRADFLFIVYLRWGCTFQSGSRDGFVPRIPDKTALLRSLLISTRVATGEVALVGNKIEDDDSRQK